MRRPSLLPALALCAIVATLCTACVKLPRRAESVSLQNALLPKDAAAAQPRRINLNTASARELERLPGIGQALAARIVEHRTRYGRFRRAEHLIIVRGISERRFRDLRDLIEVE